jgi:RimJ/RimL family protein N-acetyltransferase
MEEILMEMPERLPERQISDAAPERAPSGRRPERTTITGVTVQLEPVDPVTHVTDLYRATHADAAGEAVWRYLAYGPFASEPAMRQWLDERSQSADPLFFAIRDRISGRAGGMASFMNIAPANGSLEIGHIWFAPLLQNTRQSTEALFLMIDHTFRVLGYRRLEWKCNALNQASRSAAARLGFAYEGTFYQHMVVKGRNRDTAWFSILDSEWPLIRAQFERWLSADNFDERGVARSSLSALMRAIRSA